MTAKTRKRRLLVIGGTGVFGRRLASHLVLHCADAIDELVVTSRNAESAVALADELFLADGPNVRGIGLDVHTSLGEVLTKERPWAVVDCSSPFQNANHDVPRAVMEHGAHVIDLADARDYLLNYETALSRAAKANAVVGIAGASSTPALSGAVVRDLVSDWKRVDAIELSIVPGGRSEVGQSVLEAVLSYVGEPVPVWRGGRLDHVVGWSEPRAIDVHGLGRRRVATVETVDAERLGNRYRVSDDVTFSAGLESFAEQHGLELLAKLRAWKLIPDPTGLARILHSVRRLTRWATEDRGGMTIEVRGTNAEGRECRATWTLLATDGCGPQVPVLATAAAIRRLACDAIVPGAYVADDVLSLNDILAEAEPYPITTYNERRFREDMLPSELAYA